MSDKIEQLLESHFKKFEGMDNKAIEQALGITIPKCKSYCFLLSSYMMGSKGGMPPELASSGIIVKTIRLNNGKKPRESMSFPCMDYKGIITESWDSSSLLSILSKRFLFLFFDSLDDSTLVFRHALFWTMPPEDLRQV